jgi:hypothetical protein
MAKDVLVPKNPMVGSLPVCCARAASGHAAAAAPTSGDELAAFQLVELHLIPASQGRLVEYRIGKDQSGDNGTILQPV